LASAGAQDPDVVVTVTRSAGLAGPGLRVLVNDDPAWTGATDRAADTALRSAAARTVAVVLHELSPAADGPGAAPPPAPGPRPPPQQP
jgi:adenine/guanine phosphoribosyltransferase-like PRPP-binding protein